MHLLLAMHVTWRLSLLCPFCNAEQGLSRGCPPQRVSCWCPSHELVAIGILQSAMNSHSHERQKPCMVHKRGTRPSGAQKEEGEGGTLRDVQGGGKWTRSRVWKGYRIWEGTGGDTGHYTQGTGRPQLAHALSEALVPRPTQPCKTTCPQRQRQQHGESWTGMPEN